MEAAEYDTLRRLEDSHWWHAGLRRLLLGLIREHARLAPGARLLDLGCGTGGGSAWLGHQLPDVSLYGVDSHPLAIDAARHRLPGTLSRASVNALPFRDGAFEVVTAMDVLYHRNVDETRALGEVRRVLKPAGLLFLNQPAFEALRGEHDAAVHARERYTPAILTARLRAAGFSVLRLTCWNTFLSPAIYLRRRLQPASAAPRSDLRPLPGALEATLGLVLSLERLLLRAVDLPFGASVFAVARK